MATTFKGGEAFYKDDYVALFNKIYWSFEDYGQNCIADYPDDSDYYILWSRDEYFSYDEEEPFYDDNKYFAYGGVQLIYEMTLQQYIVKNIVFLIDSDCWRPPVDEEEHPLMYEQIGRSFYQEIYLKLGELATQIGNDPRYLLLELPEETLEKCQRHGGWPCDKRASIADNRHGALLDIRTKTYENYLRELMKRRDRLLTDILAGKSQRYISDLKKPVKVSSSTLTNRK